MSRVEQFRKVVQFWECFKLFALLRILLVIFFFQAEDGIRDLTVTGVQTCALPISEHHRPARLSRQINPVHGQRCAMEATRRRKSSNRNPVSCGPGLASGWNWTLKCG